MVAPTRVAVTGGPWNTAFCVGTVTRRTEPAGLSSTPPNSAGKRRGRRSRRGRIRDVRRRRSGRRAGADRRRQRRAEGGLARVGPVREDDLLEDEEVVLGLRGRVDDEVGRDGAV